MRDRLVHPRLPRHVAHHDPRLAQRIARLHPVARPVVGGDVLADPPVEERLGILPRREPADPVAHDRLQIMRKACAGQDVGQTRREPRIRVRLRLHVRLRPVHGRAREDHRIVGVLRMRHPDDALVGELLLAPVRDRGLRRALRHPRPRERLEGVQRKVRNLAPGVGAPNRARPPVGGERLHDGPSQVP